MTPLDLKAHKQAAKKLMQVPVFKPLKRKKLPKPFATFGGSKVQSTDLLDVSATHVVFMLWRDGDIFTDRKFFAYLYCRLANGKLSPLFEFHWHPDHKGFHCKIPCKTTFDYTNRFLPGAPELALKTQKELDPRSENDRLKLIVKFCELCGITLPDSNSNAQRLCL